MEQVKIIDIKNITLRRGDKTVLAGVRWETFPGQNWFIMGDNGSGKTSLLEVLMGYLWPQKGRVTVLGETFGHVCLPDLRKRIGYVSTWIFDHVRKDYAVEGVVASGIEAATYHGGNWSAPLKRKVVRHLEALDGRDLAGRRFGELSSGEQFKVILARALINRPALLILDEPFAFMDIGSRVKAYHLVARIARSPSAPQIVLVTHHLEDITPVFTHGLILRQGRIITRGRRDSVLSRKNLQEIFGWASTGRGDF